MDQHSKPVGQIAHLTKRQKLNSYMAKIFRSTKNLMKTRRTKARKPFRKHESGI